MANKLFSSVQMVKPQRSTFDLSYWDRSSTRMGRLTPVFIKEALPSDTFNGSSEILVRVAPLLAPIYDNLILFVHFFFVPMRLLWEDWEEFITAGVTGPGFGPEEIPPYIDCGELLADLPEVCNKSQLLDYLGVPPSMWSLAADPSDYDGIHLDVAPALAYQKIYFDYYRDRNFEQDSTWDGLLPAPSGDITAGAAANWEQTFSLRLRSYQHDYFNSASPTTQRGAEVLIPLDGAVTYLNASNVVRSSDGTLDTFSSLLGTSGTAPDNTGQLRFKDSLGDDDGSLRRIENIDTITNGTSTIEDFRSAYALQVWMERNQVGGSRYNESTMAHFGVRPQDSRLQRSEYIGGGVIPIKISEIVSTAYSQNSEDATIPLANLAGHGITYGNTNQFNYFCVEHGFILGIASIMNPPSYHQGLHKMWRRRSFLDYPWPTFARLGEQQIDKAELYADPVTLTEDADGNLPLFGYQSRYSEWKYSCSGNKGEFHDTLLFWTLTQQFASAPELGQVFVQFDDSSQDRIFAVNTGVDNFWLYVHNKVYAKRPLPYYGAPNNLGFQ